MENTSRIIITHQIDANGCWDNGIHMMFNSGILYTVKLSVKHGQSKAIFKLQEFKKDSIPHNFYEKIPLGNTGYRIFRLYSENGGGGQFQHSICAD